MNLSTILLFIIEKMSGQRSMNASLHIIRGKKSGQTLQDVDYFNSKPYFGIWPKIREELFNNAIDELIQEGFICVQDEFLYVTEKGRQAISAVAPYQFKGWDYRGREMVFFGRVALVVQTLSHLRDGIRTFVPMRSETDIQMFVKKLILQQSVSRQQLGASLSEELILAIINSRMTDRQKYLFSYRLAGSRMSAKTWEQLALMMESSVDEVYLLFIESLHKLLPLVEKNKEDYPLLHQCAANVKVHTYLTDSAYRTKKMFDHGYSMEDIAKMRQLKQSTIEDHFVEMAMNDDKFPIRHIVGEEAIEAVQKKSEELRTKRLKVLKDEFEELSYFQLRLILAVQKRGVKNEFA